MDRAFIGSAVVLAAVFVATPAWAGKPRKAGAAREHVKRATVAYNLGNFDEAVTEFEAAYKLVVDPALLFNIAQAHRQAGHADRALATYKAYLRDAPRAAGDRRQAERWREELERAQAGVPAPDPAPTPIPAPPAPPVPPAPTARAPDAPRPTAPAAATRAAPPRAAPPATTPSPAPIPSAPPAVAASATPSSGGSVLEIDLGPRFLSRAFDYTLPAPASSGYRLSLTPVVGGTLSLFPAARARGVLGNLGLLAAVEAATWLRSGIFPTGTSDVVVGLQGRVPGAFGQVSASVAFFRHAFLLRDTADPLDQPRLELEFPNTTYVGARFGLGGRFHLGSRVVMGLDAGYRWVINPGQGHGLVRSPEYFPSASISYALDAGASLGVRIAWCQVRVGIDHRRYTFGALRGATLNAAGGTDVYTALSLSVMGEFGAPNSRR